MAGGDHIHFAMQLDGVQIDPKSGGTRTGLRITLRRVELKWTAFGSRLETPIRYPRKAGTTEGTEVHEKINGLIGFPKESLNR